MTLYIVHRVEMLYEGARDFYKPFLRQEAFMEDKETFLKNVRETVLEKYLPKFNKVTLNVIII